MENNEPRSGRATERRSAAETVNKATIELRGTAEQSAYDPGERMANERLYRGRDLWRDRMIIKSREGAIGLVGQAMGHVSSVANTILDTAKEQKLGEPGI